MIYKVIITNRAEEQLDNIISYIFIQFKNKEAANSILNDVLRTYDKLEYVAASLQLCNDPYLAAKGYYKIALEKHNYLLLYQIHGNEVIVSGIFHMLENYREKL